MSRCETFWSVVIGLILSGWAAAQNTTLSAETISATTTTSAMPAAATAPVVSEAEVQTLIHALASSNEHVRDAASQKLAEIGEGARSALEILVRQNSAAEAVLARLDTNRVASATLISIDLKDAKPSAALAELTRQAGFDVCPYNDMSFNQANLGNITLSSRQEPFWNVLQNVCAQAGLVVYNSGNSDRRITLMPSNMMGNVNPMKCPTSLQGAFIVTAVSVQRNDNIDLTSKHVQRNLSLQLMVMAEPKVRVVQYTYNPEIVKAVDENGASLVGPNPNRSRDFNSGRGTVWNMAISLQAPPGSGTRIATLSGKFHYIVQTRVQTLEIDNILSAKNVSKMVAGRKLEVRSVKKAGDRQIEAQIAFYRGSLDPQQFNMDVGNPALRLLDAKDHDYTFNGYNSSNNDGEVYEAKMMFYRDRNDGGPADMGDPVKLTWDIPIATQEIVIPFEFHDIPLP